MAIQSVHPRAIRSETMIFQDAVVRQLDRINELGIDAGMNLTKDAVIAYELAIGDLYTMLSPAYTPESLEEKVEKIEKKLDLSLLAGGKISRFKYLKTLQELKGLLVKEFSQVDILPASKKDQEFSGYENIEDEEND